MPIRIQRKRTKGWRMPLGAVYVGRPTKWGNSCVVNQRCPACHVVITDAEDAVVGYRAHLPINLRQHIKDELRGKDLACWCPLDQPCHADVLLEMAHG